jgi:N-acetylmuramoyl-L-alanine amidase
MFMSLFLNKKELFLMVKKLWWDFGHGKKTTSDGTGDPGAVNTAQGLIEADLVEVIGFAAADHLKANYEGFELAYTRTDDSFVSLQHRADRANAWGADVFISFHINAGGGTGFESFIYTSPSAASISLQNILNKKAIATAAKYNLGVHGDAYKRGNLAVVRETNMPAILTETCFIDSSKDISLLKNPSFLKDMGIAYAQGVAEFVGLQKKTVSTPEENTSSDVVGKLVVVTYTGADGLNVRTAPSFDAPVATVVYEGEAFTIAAVVGDFYKLKSGLYITNSPTYVKVK